MKKRDFYRDILDRLNQAVYVRDLNKNIIYLNNKAERFSNSSIDDTTGEKCYALFGDKDKQCMNDCIIERLILKENTVKDITRKIITKDKQEKTFQVTATPYIVDNAIAGIIVILNDITDQDYLSRPAGSIPESTACIRIYDDTTCAYNKDYFLERLQSEFFISQRYATPLSLCIIEVDDFDSKKIDFGQQYTVSVIQQIVDLLKERLRRSDLIFLYSESQISVLLPYTNATAALHLSSEIKSSIQNRFLHGKETLTASIAVAEASRQMKDFSELIEVAMKSIKEARIIGNTVVCSQHR